MHTSQRFADDSTPLHAVRLRVGMRIWLGVLATLVVFAASRLGVAAEAATPPRLAQPQSFAPLPVYLPTQYPSTNAALTQPVYLAPNDEVIVTDISVAAKPTAQIAAKSPETAPQKLPATPATPTTTPSKWSGVWQLLAGPPAAVVVPPPQSKPKQVSDAPAGSLLTQILGTSSPPPDSMTKSRPAPTELTNPFLLTSAETQSDESPGVGTNLPRANRRDPAAVDLDQSSLLQQLGVAEGSRAAGPQAASTPSQSTEGVVSALWRPLVMTNNEAPTAPTAPTAATPDRSHLPESERVPSLMRPFYATNPPPRGRDATELADAPRNLVEAVADTRLGHQLAMLSSEDLRSTATVATLPGQSPAWDGTVPWDGTVVVNWPLMANPFLLTESADASALADDGVQQVAYFQESIPPPPAASGPGDDEASGDKSDEKKKEDTLAGAKKLGTAPEDTTLEFLRTSTVLLNPGDMQFDIGIQYVFTQNEFPLLLTDGMGTVIGVDNVEFNSRELAVPMEIRFGLLKRVQVFLQTSVGWSNTQVTVDDFNAFDNDGGLGDVGFGATVQLQDAERDRPYLIGTVSATAPAGGDPFTGIGIFSPSAPSLGNGFWAVGANLQWVQVRYDPVIVYYGFGARYQFAHEYIGINFEPGMQYNYTLGTGFAVNERVTLSAQFFGAYINELKADGVRLVGTNQEPMNLRFAATLAKPCNRIVEPFITFGLTPDAVNANFGVTWTY
jgi:hypothetical protein